MAVDPEEKRMIIGSIDNELRIWDIEALHTKNEVKLVDREPIYLGSIKRKYENKIINIKFDKEGILLGLHGDNNILEIYRKRTKEEINNKLKRKKTDQVEVSFEYKELTQVFSTKKIRSFDFHPTNKYKSDKEPFQLIVGTLRNSLEEYIVKGKEQELTTTIERNGHGTPIKSISFSNNNQSVCTTSNGQLKVWNLEGNSIRNFESGNGTCSLFIPGDNHVLIGTKSGNLKNNKKKVQKNQ
jgi:U3 small nucleolar RNA-associated protein 12